MRSFGIGLILTGLILASASDADAQRSTNKEMHERITALRNRLQNFQLERVRKEPQKVVPANGNETVEIQYEKLLEEFESRKDVAVTVLFHDNEFADSTDLKDSPAVVDSEDNALVQEKPAVSLPAPVRTEVAMLVTDEAPAPVQTVAASMVQLDRERAQRQEMYEQLRRKVQTATRRIHASAQEINGMVARIP